MAAAAVKRTTGQAPGKGGGADRTRITLDQPQDVRYWTRALGVSERELRNAIAMAGTTSATRIREYLQTSG